MASRQSSQHSSLSLYAADLDIEAHPFEHPPAYQESCLSHPPEYQEEYSSKAMTSVQQLEAENEGLQLCISDFQNRLEQVQEQVHRRKTKWECLKSFYKCFALPEEASEPGSGQINDYLVGTAYTLASLTWIISIIVLSYEYQWDYRMCHAKTRLFLFNYFWAFIGHLCAHLLNICVRKHPTLKQLTFLVFLFIGPVAGSGVAFMCGNLS